MKNNLTTLTLNLLISENALHRIRLSHQIIEYLETTVEADQSLEILMKSQFLNLISNCVENPKNCNRNSLFEMVAFYQKYFIVAQPVLAMAA